MIKHVSFIILVTFSYIISNAQSNFYFTIDTAQSRKPINSYIYGTSDCYAYAGTKHLGVNRLTGNNWENNASHAGVIYGSTYQIALLALSVPHLVLTTESSSIPLFIESTTITPAVGYSDGTSSFTITAEITDDNDNITAVTVDLSPVGGPATQAMSRNGNTYTYTHLVPAGTSSGIKSLLVIAVDADGNEAQSSLAYRVIQSLAPKKIWDGDLLEAGTPFMSYDGADSKRGLVKLERQLTGGNEEPGSLFMHAEHDFNQWNLFGYRFTTDDNSTTQTRNVSDYEFLEFYIKSNAPATADIDISIGDGNYTGSKALALKGRQYISAFSPTSYTRVRIPLSAFTDGTTFDLSQLWQINFFTNTATSGFDVWIDDISVIPYSHPSHQPQISDSIVTPVANFADGSTSVTVSAQVTDPDNNLQSVTVDLSPLHGPNNATMSLINGRYTITHFLPAAIAKGNKTLTITATDATNNSIQAALPFLVYQKASSDTVWNGDSKPQGAIHWVNNPPFSSLTVEPAGGSYGPGVLRMHMQKSNNGDVWSFISWNWDNNTGNIQDASQKRYLEFDMRVTGYEEQPGFSFDVFVTDRFGESSRFLNIRNYVGAFTGSYQHVRIPVDDLITTTRANRSQLNRIAIYSSNVAPANGITVYLDNITLSGSIVADVSLSAQNANCGDNGSVRVDNIPNGSPLNTYSYFIDGLPNPNGGNNPEFQGLPPGDYDIKMVHNSGFVYIAEMNVRGYPALNAAAAAQGDDVSLSVSNGSGNYTYLWSNGATTRDLSNVPDGSYTVTITDQLSGCVASAQAVVGAPLPLYQLPFTIAKAQTGFTIKWTGANQLNLHHYDVLHSTNGQNFKVINRVDAEASKEQSGGVSYEANHFDPVRGKNYYQIKLVCKDGRPVFSTIRAVTYNEGQGENVVALPNPVLNKVHLKTHLKITGLAITDINGREVTGNISYELKSNGVWLDLQGQPPGIYIITVKHDNGAEKIKVNKL